MMVTGLLVMLGTPAYVALQLWAAVRLRGRWRTAALLPLVPGVPLVAWCTYAFADQSNLWPLPFVLFAPFGALYLALILALGRKSLRAHAAN